MGNVAVVREPGLLLGDFLFVAVLCYSVRSVRVTDSSSYLFGRLNEKF